VSRRIAITAVLTAAATIAVVVAVASRDDAPTRSSPPPKPTYAELAAANYRVLSAAQSRRLLAFAEAFQACMTRRGLALGRPRPQPTKIVMRLAAGVDGPDVARLSVRCADPLGGPPPGSSLVQHRGGKTIELYLPKRCLLDRKVVGARG
jgi:hypothetical protein